MVSDCLIFQELHTLLVFSEIDENTWCYRFFKGVEKKIASYALWDIILLKTVNHFFALYFKHLLPVIYVSVITFLR